MREAVHRVGAEADEGEELARAVEGFGAGDALDHGALSHEFADPAARVERGVRVLEHHLDAAALGAESGGG